MNPTVSVIIPTYNRPQFLARAIASVAAQTLKDLEILVIQNGGTRESEAVVRQFKDQGLNVEYLYETKPDPVHARNVGILRAKGQYIAFLDDDDEWLPEKLERQIAVLGQWPDVGLVTSRSWLMDDAGVVTREGVNFDYDPTLLNLFEHGCMTHSLSGILVKRECFDRVGLFNTWYPIVNDYEFYLRVAQHFRMLPMKDILYRYRVHAGNLSRDYWRTFVENIRVLQRLAPAPEKGLTREMIRARIARWYYTLATQSLDQKVYGRAARFYFGAVTTNPLIGGAIPWGRSSNPLYRICRPYLATLYCSVKALGGRS